MEPKLFVSAPVPTTARKIEHNFFLMRITLIFVNFTTYNEYFFTQMLMESEN